MTPKTVPFNRRMRVPCMPLPQSARMKRMARRNVYYHHRESIASRVKVICREVSAIQFCFIRNLTDIVLRFITVFGHEEGECDTEETY